MYLLNNSGDEMGVKKAISVLFYTERHHFQRAGIDTKALFLNDKQYLVWRIVASCLSSKTTISIVCFSYYPIQRITFCLHAVFFHHNNKSVGKCTTIASEVQGFPNHLASFPNLWKSMVLLHAIQFQLKGCFTTHTWSLQRRAGTLVIQKSHSREGTCAMAKAR